MHFYSINTSKYLSFCGLTIIIPPPAVPNCVGEEIAMNFVRASALSLALCALAVPAFAQTFGSPGTGPNGPYIRGEGGWSHMNDTTGDSTTGDTVTTKQKEGYAVGGAIGWKLDQLRLELGLDFSNSGVKAVDVNNVPATTAS